MFIPVGTYAQQIMQVDKDEHGRVTEIPLLDVMVPYHSSFAFSASCLS